MASAGSAVESAVQSLRSRAPRMFQARASVMRAASDLLVAAGYAKASGRVPNLQSFLAQLAAFYEAEAKKILRPSGAAAVASELAANQGLLASADPFGPAAPSS